MQIVAHEKIRLHSRVDWSFGDGAVLTNWRNDAYHVWAAPGDYPVTFTAFSLDHLEGVSASTMVRVVPFAAPVLSRSVSAGGGLALSFYALPGVFYQPQQTTNLANTAAWQTVTSLSGTGSEVLYLDPNMTNEVLFYRLRVIP